MDPILKCLKLKLRGQHPSKKLSIKAIMYSMKKYGGRVNFVLHKRGGDFEPSFMEDVGYYDFFTMEVVSNVSESCVSLSFLPWKELEGLFHYDVVEEDDDED